MPIVELWDLRSSKGTQRWANMSPATAGSTASERTTTPSKTVYNKDSSNVSLLSHIRTPGSLYNYATKPWWQAPLLLTRAPYGVEERLRLGQRAGYFYSPSCREEEFSATRWQKKGQSLNQLRPLVLAFSGVSSQCANRFIDALSNLPRVIDLRDEPLVGFVLQPYHQRFVPPASHRVEANPWYLDARD